MPKLQTNMLKGTVVDRAMVTWNTLPGYIIQENSKNLLKILLKKHLLAEQLSVPADIKLRKK